MDEESLRLENAELHKRCEEMSRKLQEIERENAVIRFKLMEQAQLLKPSSIG